MPMAVGGVASEVCLERKDVKRCLKQKWEILQLLGWAVLV